MVYKPILYQNEACLKQLTVQPHNSHGKSKENTKTHLGIYMTYK